LVGIIQTDINFFTFSALVAVIRNDLRPRHKNDLHLPHACLTTYQRGVLYSGVKIFNALPMAIKDTSGNPRKFKVVLKHYLLTHSYYDLEELFSQQNT
jgi:hypothetical protein